MATIELDIIKQRSDKLLPEEKLELINYLTASLASEELGNLDSDQKNVLDPDTSSDEIPT